MGKYRTSPYKIIKCGDLINGSGWVVLLSCWGFINFLSPVQGFTTGARLGLENGVDGKDAGSHYGFLPLTSPEPLTPNCTPSALSQFPPDAFTKQERLKGALLLHLSLAIYCFYAIFLICDDYFVPSIEAITRALRISTDLAGATFMAISTSAPELFTNIIGTFVTKGDMGVGTIVGSAVFNILAVGSCCGLFAVKLHRRQVRPGVELEWYPLTRDCLFYLCSVGLLLLVLQNRKIYWYEALTLLLFYFIYVLVMCNNHMFKRWAEGFVSKCTNMRMREVTSPDSNRNEKAPLLKASDIKAYDATEKDQFGPMPSTSAEASTETSTEEEEIRLKLALLHSESRCQEEKMDMALFSFPKHGGCGTMLCWFLSWPIRLCFTLTIPDCREERWKRWHILTLVMCVVWIASLTYVASWMMEVAGETLDIPESVTGLTVLAAGTSIPEVISSVIVARQGFGAMGLSNSIGSNTFDLLFCLGLPWFIQCLVMIGTDTPYVTIHSSGLEYSVTLLIMSLFLFYVTVAFNKFVLDWRVGLICLLMYAAFIPIACLLEMNFFFPVNLPPCP